MKNILKLLIFSIAFIAGLYFNNSVYAQVCSTSRRLDTKTCSYLFDPLSSTETCLENWSLGDTYACTGDTSDCRTLTSNCSSSDTCSIVAPGTCGCTYSYADCWVNNTTTPHCNNNIQDADETGVDCGGADCSVCGTGGPGNALPGGAWCALYASPVSVPIGQTVGLSIEMRYANVYDSATVGDDCTTVDGDPVDSPPVGPPFGLDLIGTSNIAIASTPGNTGYVCGPPSDGNNRFYSINVRGESIGPTSIVIKGIVSGPGACTSTNCVCSVTVPVTVTGPKAWWQVRNGNVMVGDSSAAGSTARISSQIPATCTLLNGCNPNFIIDDDDSDTPSGVAISPSNSTFRAGATSLGKPNSQNWYARTQLNGDASSAEFYFNLAKSKKVYDLDVDPDGLGFAGVLDGAITEYVGDSRNNWVDEEDVAWLKTANDLDIRNLVVANNPSTGEPNKVVVLIECGSLTVGESPPGVGRLQVNEPNSNFIFIVVGKCSDNTKGKVTVKKRVKELDGVIIADGDVEILSEANCIAGEDDKDQLNFRGNLIAKGRVILNRDFCQKENNGDDGNEDQPTETFENLEEWDLLFPSSLSEKHIYWREIVP